MRIRPANCQRMRSCQVYSSISRLKITRNLFETSGRSTVRNTDRIQYHTMIMQKGQSHYTRSFLFITLHITFHLKVDRSVLRASGSLRLRPSTVIAPAIRAIISRNDSLNEEYAAQVVIVTFLTSAISSPKHALLCSCTPQQISHPASHPIAAENVNLRIPAH